MHIPLFDTLAARGVRFTQVNGWRVTLDYGAPAEEAAAFATGAALLDRGAWGRVVLSGADRLAFLQRMSTNDFSALPPGQGRATVFTDPRGRMVDRVVALARADDTLLLAGLGAGERVAAWLRGYIFFRDKVRVTDATATLGMLTLYGPRAAEVARDALGAAPTALYEHVPVEMDGGATLVAASDPLGGGGVDVVAETAALPALWTRLQAAGATPVGFAAFEQQRVAVGWPQQGQEITDDYNPLEAGLLGAVSFTKGCYIGQEVVARLDTYQKLKQHLMGLRLARAGDVAPGARLEKAGQAVGTLTSVAATDDGAVGLGYVRAAHAAPGAEVEVVSGEERVPARLVALPGRWTRPFGL